MPCWLLGGCDGRTMQHSTAGAFTACMHIEKACRTYQSSAKGFDSSMVEPLSPASLATCNHQSLSALDPSAQLFATHLSQRRPSHLAEGRRTTPSIVLSGYTQRQHVGSEFEGSRSSSNCHPKCWKDQTSVPITVLLYKLLCSMMIWLVRQGSPCGTGRSPPKRFSQRLAHFPFIQSIINRTFTLHCSV
jgi:hypothetical protein